MRFLHLSDLHIGKKLNGFCLLEDQKYILNQIIDMAKEYDADAVIIAGDIYDTLAPAGEAVSLLDYFLTKLLKLNKRVFIISGNHDSPERLGFCSRILQEEGLYIAGIFSGNAHIHMLTDEYGPINIYMLPFIKPSHVKAYYDYFDTDTYNDALKLVIDNTDVNPDERNILIAHQFVTATGDEPILSDSETKSVGGLDNVSYTVFDKFDYVALGHLHAPQSVGRNTVVYGGSPLKYSVSERHQNKCAVLVELKEKGSVSVIKLKLSPLRDIRQIKGPLKELVKELVSDDYISVILTDKTRHLEPYKRLRAVYKNCISVTYEGEEVEHTENTAVLTAGDLKNKTTAEIFEDLYIEQNGEKLDNLSRQYLGTIFEGLAGGSQNETCLP